MNEQDTAKLLKVIRLNNCWKLDDCKTISLERIDPVIISGLPVPKQKGYFQDLRDHLRVIIANLYHAFRSDPERYIAYSRSANSYKKDKAHKGFQFSYSNAIKVIDYLIKEGYIEHIPGHYGLKQSHLSRMRATSKLIELIQSGDVTRDIGETIIVKGAKPNRKERPILKTPDNLKVRTMRDNLKVINDVINKADITLNITEEELKTLNTELSEDKDKYRQPIDMTKKTLHRVFLSKLDLGGRFYGAWYQNILKEFRRKIFINGLPTMEPDFSSYHIAILYALENLPLPEEDPYTLTGYPREFLKKVLLIILNAKDKKTAINRIKFEISIGKLANIGLNVIDQFTIKHKPIQHYFYTGCGIKLQYYDSQLAEEILLHFARKGIPCLPVHDSFVINFWYALELQITMLEIFKKKFKRYINIKIDQSRFCQDMVNALGVCLDEGIIDKKIWQEQYNKMAKIDYSILPEYQIKSN